MLAIGLACLDTDIDTNYIYPINFSSLVFIENNTFAIVTSKEAINALIFLRHSYYFEN